VSQPDNEYTTSEPTHTPHPPLSSHSQDEDYLIGVFTTNGELVSRTEVSGKHLPALLALTEEKPKKTRKEKLPAITSSTQTKLPNTPTFEAFTQSFGPALGVQLSLWGDQDTKFELLMPNGTTLTIIGNNPLESMALYKFVTTEYGPEGIKFLLLIFDTYYSVTQGRDPNATVTVTARQLLQRLGRGKKADDKKEQQKIMSSFLFLARTFVAKDKGPAKKRLTPLLHIEGYDLEPDEQGNFEVPTEIEYRLGKHFQETLQFQHFYVPTARLLGYHSVREHQELLLAIYLCKELATQAGRCSFPFVTLLVQSALLTPEDIKSGINRTRDALRVLYALEHLENDGLIIRQAQKEIDTVLAMDLSLNEMEISEKVSPQTLKRLRKVLPSLLMRIQEDQSTPRAEKRQALQSLLDEEKNITVSFTIGPILTKQLETQSQQVGTNKNSMSRALLINEPGADK